MMYVYLLEGDEHEHELALAEAVALAGGEPCGDKLVVAERRIDLARTGYVLAGMELIAGGRVLGEVCGQVRAAGLAADRFAIDVRRIPRGLKVHRKEIATALANAIDGSPDLDDPAERFAAFVTAGGIWFGRPLDAGEPEWCRLSNKPHDFSSALPAQAARAICNLMIRGGERVVDPCCGTGTLLLHAASLGATVTGYDLNRKMMWATNKNLVHFGFGPAAEEGDATKVRGEFDVLLTNPPYGRMTPTTDDALRRIVANAVTLAPRGVIVGMHDLAPIVRGAGVRVREVLHLAKFSITRRILIYERG